MNEIIWALNPSNDSLYNLVTYLHRYTREYMELYQIPVTVKLPPAIPRTMVSAAFRRNVFLVVKEMLHNVVKHAAAAHAELDIGVDEAAKRLSVVIRDEIQGEIDITSRPGHGTTVSLQAPYAL
jgi:signal transduction histidine kinase